jgi:hypothetical protein
VADLLRRASSNEDQPPAPARPDPAAESGPIKRSPPRSWSRSTRFNRHRPGHRPRSFGGALGSLQAGGAKRVHRRLYTLQGQKTFDELRRKYERDGDFRRAVDNYIADFERLLAEVSSKDADRRYRAKYLTSDTGKVYTMLAHAAGKLA